MTANFELSFSEAHGLILEQFQYQVKNPAIRPVTPYIQGRPGIGKSALSNALGASLNIPREAIELLRFAPVEREPQDMLGLPFIENQTTQWAMPKLYRDTLEVCASCGAAILSIDDLLKGSPAMVKTASRLVYERKLGDFPEFPRNVLIIASGNGSQDGAGDTRMFTHTGNRMCIVNLTYSADEWRRWAITQQSLDTDPVAFIGKRPDLLFDFSPSRPTNATPRSWESVGAIAPKIKENPKLYRAAVAGLVGDGPAAEYTAYLDLRGALPEISQVVSNPSGAPVPDGNPSGLYAVTTMLLHYATATNIGAIAAYMERIPKEFQMLFYSDLVAAKAHLADTRAYQEWSIKNIDLCL